MTSCRQEWQIGLEIALDCLARIVLFGVVGGGKSCLKTSISSLLWIPSCWLIGNHNEKQKERWRGSCQARAWLLLGQMFGDWENSGFKKNCKTLVEGNAIILIGIVHKVESISLLLEIINQQHKKLKIFSLALFFFFCLFVFFLGPHLVHMEFPRLGVELEL